MRTVTTLWSVPAPLDPLDYYARLGVSETATAGDIRHAWRKTARRLHPDTAPTGTAEENASEFILASQAYDVLIDAKARRAYDLARSAARRGPSSHEEPVHAAGPADPMRSPKARRSGYSPLTQPGPAVDAIEWGAVGQDVRALMTIGFSAAVFGSTIEVFLSRREVCRTCAGEPPDRGCASCGEEGSELVETMAEVVTPPGVANGSTLTLAQAGDVGPRAGHPGSRRGIPGPPGDLVVEFTVTSHAGVAMAGTTLVYDFPVDVIDALLGCQQQIRLIDGPALVVVTPGSAPGFRIRIAGRGVPLHGHTRGDALAEVRIVMRTQLTAEDRAVLGTLRRRR